MRRYFHSRHQASPSKDNIRRRLFETPKRSRPLHGLTVRHKFVTIITGVGASFLIGVHLYLFRHVIISTSNNSGNLSSKLGPIHDVRGSAGVGGLPNSDNDQRQWPPHRRGPIRPLGAIDVERYTIRMNTWRRPEQLLVSVEHHASCEGVAQIQIVWCDKENEPPAALFNYSKVVIERHEENTLNERFRILASTPTLGILSVDDDALRPCAALDAGFFKWTKFPDRMIGFDARLHIEEPDGSWKYGYMSTMEKENKYSLSLTRYCFVHRDYMDMYINDLPQSILKTVAENLNCEDIAMSFMISSLTDGKPSLLADFWAIKSMIKLYVEEKISGGKSHKTLRDECVDSFAALLGLKDDSAGRLHAARYTPKTRSLFECGDNPGATSVLHQKSQREIELENVTKRWQDQGNDKTLKEVKGLMSEAGLVAYKHGLIQKTEKWKERFQNVGGGFGD